MPQLCAAHRSVAQIGEAIATAGRQAEHYEEQDAARCLPREDHPGSEDETADHASITLSASALERWCE